MLDSQPEMNRFEALCAEVEEYDHLPEVSHDRALPAQMLTGLDHEAELDAEILAGLVSP